jgi:hypothetical protein
MMRWMSLRPGLHTNKQMTAPKKELTKSLIFPPPPLHPHMIYPSSTTEHSPVRPSLTKI